MKNVQFLLGSAFVLTLSAASLCSCSSDENLAAMQEEELVQISLGAKSTTVSTRAVEVNEWAGHTIGVFGLINNEDGFKTTNTPVLFGGQSVLANVAAGGAVTMTDDYYYPRNSENTYSFYAYYPTCNPMITADSVYVRSNTFNGNADIMAGRTEYTENAWNARYVRQNIATPELVFNHLTTQFKVLFLQGVSSAGYNETMDCNRIARAYINVPNTYTLTLAKKGLYKTYVPTIYWGTTVNTPAVLIGTGAEYGTGDHAEEFANAHNGGQVVPWQTYDLSRSNSYKANTTGLYNNLIFVPAGVTEYELNIEFVDNTKQKVNIHLGDNSAFKAGTAYNVTVTIYGPEKIEMNATITPWETGEDIDLDIQ